MAWWWAIALAPLAGLTTYALVQPLVQHLTGRGRPAKSLAIGFLAGLAASGALVGVATHELELSLLDAGALFVVQGLSAAALGYGYWAFVNLNLASIRIRIMKEVSRAGSEGLPAAELAKLYDEEGMAEGRLERLVAGGHLLLKDGRHLSGRQTLLRIGYVIEALKHVILGHGSRLGSAVGSGGDDPSS